MSALILVALIGASILASAVCMLFILWILDREEGRMRAVLGFFFPPYAYFWAWWHTRRLGLTPVLLLWTLSSSAAVILALVLEVRF